MPLSLHTVSQRFCVRPHRRLQCGAPQTPRSAVVAGKSSCLLPSPRWLAPPLLLSFFLYHYGGAVNSALRCAAIFLDRFSSPTLPRLPLPALALACRTTPTTPILPGLGVLSETVTVFICRSLASSSTSSTTGPSPSPCHHRVRPVQNCLTSTLHTPCVPGSGLIFLLRRPLRPTRRKTGHTKRRFHGLCGPDVCCRRCRCTPAVRCLAPLPPTTLRPCPLRLKPHHCRLLGTTTTSGGLVPAERLEKRIHSDFSRVPKRICVADVLCACVYVCAVPRSQPTPRVLPGTHRNLDETTHTRRNPRCNGPKSEKRVELIFIGFELPSSV